MWCWIQGSHAVNLFCRKSELFKFSVTLYKFLAGWNTHNLFHGWQCLMIECKNVIRRRSVSQSVWWLITHRPDLDTWKQFDDCFHQKDMLGILSERLSFLFSLSSCEPTGSDLLLNRPGNDDRSNYWYDDGDDKYCLLSDPYQCKSYFMTNQSIYTWQASEPPSPMILLLFSFVILWKWPSEPLEK